MVLGSGPILGCPRAFDPLQNSALPEFRDERFASGRERMIACPGSVQQERNTAGLLAGKAALNGTLRHEGLEGIPRALKALSEDSDFQRILSSYDKGVVEGARLFFGDIEAEIRWEHRAILYGLLDEPIFSARWDLLISARINGSKCALIAEFKTGYYPVAEADTNPQTRRKRRSRTMKKLIEPENRTQKSLPPYSSAPTRCLPGRSSYMSRNRRNWKPSSRRLKVRSSLPNLQGPSCAPEIIVPSAQPFIAAKPLSS
jgi:hypothetical protein